MPRLPSLLSVVTACAAASSLAAGADDPWRAPPVREAIAAWARGEAHRLHGEHAEAQRLLAAAADACREALAARHPAAWEPILKAVLARSRAPVDRPPEAPSATDALRETLLLKTRADGAAARGDALAARLGYEAALESCLRLRERFPKGRDAKAVAWLEARAQRAIGALPAGGLRARPRPVEPIEQAVRQAMAVPKPEPGSVALRLDLHRVGVGPIGVRRVGITPPPPHAARGGGVLEHGAVVSVVGRRSVGLLIEAIQSGRIAVTAAQARRLLAWIADNGAGHDLAAKLSDALSGAEAAGTEGAITMGGGAAPGGGLKAIELDALLDVLCGAAEPDKDGRRTRRALELATELRVLEPTAARLRQCLRTQRPGMAGVLLFGILRLQGQHDDAFAQLLALADAPDGRLPVSGATRSALEEGFRHFIAQRDPAHAERLLAALDPYKLRQRNAQLIDLAIAWSDAGQADNARDIATRVLASRPDPSTARRARAIVGGPEANLHKDGKPVLTDAELAALAREARVSPRLYERLGTEYRRAGKYREAREALDIAARRSDRPSAARALVEACFEDGDLAAAEDAAAAFLAKHHGSPHAEALATFAARHCLERGDVEAWGRLCLRLAESPDKTVAAPYCERLALLLLKSRLAAGPAHAVGLVAVERRLERSAARAQVEAQIEQELAAVGAGFDVWEPPASLSPEAWERLAPARRAVIETYFEQGGWATAEDAAAAFLTEHHGSRDAGALVAFAARHCLERGAADAWGRVCLRLAESPDESVAAFYCKQLALLLLRSRLAAGPARAAGLAAVEQRLERSAAGAQVEAQIEQELEAVGAGLNVWEPPAPLTAEAWERLAADPADEPAAP